MNQLPVTGHASSAAQQFKLQPGATVNVQLLPGKKQLSCRLIGYLPGVGLVVTAPKGVSTLGIEGAPVALKVLSGNHLCVGNSRLLKVHASPYPHWHLAYPDALSCQPVRRHARIPLDMRVALEMQDADKNPDWDLPRVVPSRYISLEDIWLDASSPLAPVGELLLLTLRFKVNGLEQLLLISGELEHIEEEEPGLFLHKVRLEQQEEESHLLLSAFVYQCYLIELGYLDYGSSNE